METEDFLKSQLSSTDETSDVFKEGLKNTVKQIDSGYKQTMIMYNVVFYLGVLLIVVGLIVALTSEKDIIGTIFSGMGVLEVLVFFITKPPQNLQGSRAKLAQLQACLFTWFIDLGNWNGLLLQNSKIGETNYEELSNVSQKSIESTEKIMQLIDTHCNPFKK